MITGVLELNDFFLNWNKVQSIAFINKEDDNNNRHLLVKFETDPAPMSFGVVTESAEESFRKQLRENAETRSTGFGV